MAFWKLAMMFTGIICWTEFKKENPNITVELVTAPYGEIMNTVINMAAAEIKLTSCMVTWTGFQL